MLKRLLLLIFTGSLLHAGEMTIFAASDLKFALDTVKTKFLKEHPKDTIRIIYGSSGKGRVQVANGAPYDLYFSANMDYVTQLYKNGDVVTKPKLYAIGRLVIWSTNSAFDAKKGFANLRTPWAEKIAIANPSHAPYGEKAKQALESKHLYGALKPKIVLGENISQTANYIKTGAADAGIIALSLALAPTVAKSEHRTYYLIDEKLHEPLRQGYGITEYGQHNPLAKAFYRFFQSDEAQQIMKRYGFSVPGA
ncbi:molybdate ABC transporter substrate-binding protein [Sulfurovum sp.]|uniref:molybdate ABC transporter substrate-binding protein n=1 Tax=Sulfurovum sp. TaxID=1969726 RepID=UPI0025F0732D|nr:molybdate ABC transporter substrate-binding protein [Sulfurovum sp.]